MAFNPNFKVTVEINRTNLGIFDRGHVTCTCTSEKAFMTGDMLHVPLKTILVLYKVRMFFNLLLFVFVLERCY